MIDYRYIPSAYNENTQRLLEDAAVKLRVEVAKAQNAWLDGCIKRFCPIAYQYASLGDTLSLTMELNERELHYRINGDVMEFCEGDTVLARAKFELNLGFKCTPDTPHCV